MAYGRGEENRYSKEPLSAPGVNFYSSRKRREDVKLTQKLARLEAEGNANLTEIRRQIHECRAELQSEVTATSTSSSSGETSLQRRRRSFGGAPSSVLPNSPAASSLETVAIPLQSRYSIQSADRRVGGSTKVASSSVSHLQNHGSHSEASTIATENRNLSSVKILIKQMIAKSSTANESSTTTTTQSSTAPKRSQLPPQLTVSKSLDHKLGRPRSPPAKPPLQRNLLHPPPVHYSSSQTESTSESMSSSSSSQMVFKRVSWDE